MQSRDLMAHKVLSSNRIPLSAAKAIYADMVTRRIIRSDANEWSRSFKHEVRNQMENLEIQAGYRDRRQDLMEATLEGVEMLARLQKDTINRASHALDEIHVKIGIEDSNLPVSCQRDWFTYTTTNLEPGLREQIVCEQIERRIGAPRPYERPPPLP